MAGADYWNDYWNGMKEDEEKKDVRHLKWDAIQTVGGQKAGVVKLPSPLGS